MVISVFLFTVALSSSCSAQMSAEGLQTSRLLGVRLLELQGSQGVKSYEEVGRARKPFKFEYSNENAQLTIPKPKPSYEPRKSVFARHPNGKMIEAFCERPNDPNVILPSKLDRNERYARQWYGSHHGYQYSPTHIYVGERESGVLRSRLMFPDVGSHQTAPHHFSIDSEGRAHLVVADVNISDDNAMDLYWVVGDLSEGKWLSATLVDQRGFTSVSHPWTGAAGNRIHLVWGWDGGANTTEKDGNGLYYLDRVDSEFGRKVRFVEGAVSNFDAALDPDSGLLLVAYTPKGSNGVYLVSRSSTGEWTFPTLIEPGGMRGPELLVRFIGNGVFVVCSSTGLRTIRPS